ncbi:GtrA family protein [Gammaproteobacteria bacterium]|nr:GtrA family protein [Gammaproteobacteria bacterium]
MLYTINKNETSKFIVNGIFAALVHFFFLISLTTFTDANYGFSNFIACIFGSMTSFVGNKYFVFKFYNQSTHTIIQLYKFLLLYLFLCLNAGLALYFWTDIYGYYFIYGFLGITVINTILGFLANKFLVFGTLK